MRKARDHVGAGATGMIDAQGTAVSEDAPGWFVGIRTSPGPYSLKAVPVRRCPATRIEGKEYKVYHRKYERGENMSTLESFMDPHSPETSPIKSTVPEWRQSWDGPRENGRRVGAPSTFKLHYAESRPPQFSRFVSRESCDGGAQRIRAPQCR